MICKENLAVVRNIINTDKVQPLQTCERRICYAEGKEYDKTVYPDAIVPATDPLVCYRLDVYPDHKTTFFYPFVAAIDRNKLEIVRYFIKICKIDVNVIFPDKTTPLYHAIVCGSVEVTQYLLNHGASLEFKNCEYGNTALELINYRLTSPSAVFATFPKANFEKIKLMIEQAIAAKEAQEPSH